jgi:exopolysaccharide/PEP-CTERM locus tyrosine autokinase
VSVIDKALRKLREAGAPVETSRLVGGVDTPPPSVAAEHGTKVTRKPADPNRRVIQIDEAALRAAQLLPPASEIRQTEDEFRVIKRAVLRAAFEDVPQPGPSKRVVAVTSAYPGDGKTHCTINLALSLARERDHQVIMIDGDVAKPHISHLFKIDDETGLLDTLAERQESVLDAILPTIQPGLWLLPAGRHLDHASELLASDQMRGSIDALLSNYPDAILLIDCPPLLLTSEAKAISAIAGQILLVVKSGHTQRDAVISAVEATNEPERVRVIFNYCSSSASKDYYGERSSGSSSRSSNLRG